MMPLASNRVRSLFYRPQHRGIVATSVVLQAYFTTESLVVARVLFLVSVKEPVFLQLSRLEMLS